MRLLILLLGLYYSVELFGQETVLVRTYGGGGSEEFRAVVSSGDGGYLMTGTTGSQPGMSTDIYTVRTDSLLNCEWSLTLGSEGVDVGQDLVTDESGMIYLCGFRSGVLTNGYDAVVYKISPDGTVLWDIGLGGEDWDFGNAIDLDSGGLIWLGGSTFIDGVRKPWLTSFNSEGESNSQWILPCVGAGEIRDLICTTTGVLICGYVESEVGDKQSAVWRLDQEGSIVWQRFEGEPGNDREASGIQANEDNVFVCGSHETDTFIQGYSQRLNMDGAEQLWSPELQPGNNEYTAVIPAGESYYAIGRTEGYGFGGYDGIVFRFSNSGGFEGGLFYGTENEDSFIGGAAAPGGFIACGKRENADGQWQALAMIYQRSVLFSEDIMTPEDASCLPVGIMELHHTPAANGAYRVFDLTGRQLSVGFAADIREIPGTLHSGVYLVVFDSGFATRMFVQ